MNNTNRMLRVGGLLLLLVGLPGCCWFCDPPESVTCGDGTIKSDLGDMVECVPQEVVQCGNDTLSVLKTDGEPEGGLTGERECVTAITCGEGTHEVQKEGGLTGERECVPDDGEPEGGLTGER